MPRLPHPPDFYRKLHDSASRREAGLFLAVGRKLFYEALHSVPPDHFHAVFYESSDTLAEIPSSLRDKAYKLPSWQIVRISGQETPEGIISVLRLPPPPSFPPYPAAVLVERLQDPGNLGTLLRAMEWLGCQHLWLTEDSADPYAPKAVRASMGSIFRMQVRRVKAWGDLLAGYEGRCAVADREGIPAHEVDWRQYDTLYIGSEAHGATRAPAHWLRVSIPPSPSSRAESLNLAVAATILLYLQRQVRAGKLHTSLPG